MKSHAQFVLVCVFFITLLVLTIMWGYRVVVLERQLLEVCEAMRLTQEHVLLLQDTVESLQQATIDELTYTSELQTQMKRLGEIVDRMIKLMTEDALTKYEHAF